MHTKRNIRICVVLLILNVLFIWGNSLLPANLSAAFSRYVKKILEYILPFGSDEAGVSHGILRKIAHFTEFISLGALLAWLYKMLQQRTSSCCFAEFWCWLRRKRSKHICFSEKI